MTTGPATHSEDNTGDDYGPGQGTHGEGNRGEGTAPHGIRRPPRPRPVRPPRERPERPPRPRPEHPRPVRPEPSEPVEVPLSRQFPASIARMQRDGLIVRLFAMGESAASIGRAAGISEGRVRQIVKAAQDKEPRAAQ